MARAQSIALGLFLLDGFEDEDFTWAVIFEQS
jgi:hypothetical protein